MHVTAVRFEGFDVEVRGGAPEARAVADSFLGGAWRVDPGIGNPQQHDLLPPDGMPPLDLGEAWEIARKMIEDVRVLSAEPIVVLEGDVYWNWAASRRAIETELGKGSDVISVSRGGPIGGRSLHQAVRQAVAKGTMIAATARDRWPFPVYPAKYPEVVALASMETATAEVERWTAQHRGTEIVAVHQTRLGSLLEFFPDVDPAVITSALLQLLNTTEAQLESQLELFGSELEVHVAMDTDIRARLGGWAEPGMMLPLSRSLRAKMQPAV